MTNDEGKICYHFPVKNLAESYSLGWSRSRKEAIINGNNCFQNALNDALNYQNIEKDLQRITKIKNLNEIIRQVLLIYYLYHTINK